jgi:hypothetical protein
MGAQLHLETGSLRRRITIELMNAIRSFLLRGVILTLVHGSTGENASAQEISTDSPRISKRMSDAILSEFKKVDSSQFARSLGPLLPSPLATFDEPAHEADPDVVVLPTMTVRGRRAAELLTRDAVTLPPPSELGTGITEYRGKRFSVLTQRILFIPVGFKLAW